MGAGKSTIGRQLAEHYRRPLVDIDSAIEERCGADIPWIFDVEGEQGFRRRESAMLAEVLAEPQPLVIATGGGIVTVPANRELLRSGVGTVIYLTASAAQILRRTRNDSSRPLLQVADRAAVVEQILAEREPLYREVAGLTFRSGDGSAGRSAARLIEQIEAL
jgi:shikimate kinase